MLGVDSGSAAVGRGNLRNNLAYTGTLTSNMTGTSAANNSWNLGVTLSDACSRASPPPAGTPPASPTAACPRCPTCVSRAGSALIDKGVNVGLPFQGKAPDLGAFETVMKARKRAALTALMLAGISGIVGVTMMPSDAATTPGAADYTANSWSAYTSKKTAADGLVMVRGLKTLVAEYRKRTPSKYTASSWAPFATALTTASDVTADAAATAAQVAAAKTTLTDFRRRPGGRRRGHLPDHHQQHLLEGHQRQPHLLAGRWRLQIRRHLLLVRRALRGRRALPGESDEEVQQRRHLRLHPGLLVARTWSTGSSRTTSRPPRRPCPAAPKWGRLGRPPRRRYNEKTGKYVLAVQMWHTPGGGVLFLRGDSPTDTFDCAACRRRSPTRRRPAPATRPSSPTTTARTT